MIANPEQQRRFEAHFSFLGEASDPFRRQFFSATTLVKVPDGHTIATEGAVCHQLALVLEGSVRVYKLAASGREITLYRIPAGDSCILTASCIMSQAPFPAIAVAEGDVDALIVPARQAQEWLLKSQPWGAFVFGLIAKRLAEVIGVLESVTFQRMDIRIATYLIALAPHGKTLTTTHHEIASELGTSREVVSRMLKEFERRGWLVVGRGEVDVLAPAELRALIQGQWIPD